MEIIIRIQKIVKKMIKKRKKEMINNKTNLNNKLNKNNNNNKTLKIKII